MNTENLDTAFLYNFSIFLLLSSFIVISIVYANLKSLYRFRNIMFVILCIFNVYVFMGQLNVSMGRYCANYYTLSTISTILKEPSVDHNALSQEIDEYLSEVTFQRGYMNLYSFEMKLRNKYINVKQSTEDDNSENLNISQNTMPRIVIKNDESI